MCILCNQGRPQHPYFSRRNFLKGAAATGARRLSLFAPRPARAHDDDGPPRDTGRPGRRYLINGGSDHVDGPAGRATSSRGDVLIEGKKILCDRTEPVRRRRRCDRRARQHRDARLHRHASPSGLDGDQKLHSRQHPDRRRHGHAGRATELLFRNVLAAGTPASPATTGRRTSTSANWSAGSRNSTTASPPCTTFRRSITRRSIPTPRCRALFDAGRRGAFGYFESAGTVPGNQYPTDATRIKQQWFSSSDQLIHMIMGGEVYLGPASTPRHGRSGASSACRSRRISSRRSAYARSWTTLPPDRPPTTMSIGVRQPVHPHDRHVGPGLEEGEGQVGAQVSIAFPIEMNMRHGIPPILKMQSSAWSRRSAPTSRPT